jgi:hypothetical protein
MSDISPGIYLDNGRLRSERSVLQAIGLLLALFSGMKIHHLSISMHQKARQWESDRQQGNGFRRNKDDRERCRKGSSLALEHSQPARKWRLANPRGGVPNLQQWWEIKDVKKLQGTEAQICE